MQRDIFLQMCQKVSMLKNGVCGLKENGPDDLKVIFNGITYYPYGYKLWFDGKGNPVHTAVLKDLIAKSIIECNLERVEKYA